MAQRNQERPFQKLGAIIESWRAGRFKSALSLYKQHAKNKPFSFSYSTYADFERGVTLPSISQILEIADHFEQDRAQVALLWAQIQMPPDLKYLFNPEAAAPFPTMAASPSLPVDEDAVAPLSLENTWVLGPQEHKLLKQRPDLIDALLHLAVEYPRWQSSEALGGPDVTKLLESFVKEGRILEDAGNFRLKDPFFHIPKSREWKEVRVNNARRAFSRIMEDLDDAQLSAGTGFHGVVTRKLTAEEAQKLTALLQTVEKEMLSTKPGGKRRIYSFMAALGPRKLRPDSG